MRIMNLRRRFEKLASRLGKGRKHQLAAAVVTGGLLFSGSAANSADIVINGGFETPTTGWTNQGTDYTHPYGGLNGPQLTEVGTLTDYGFNDDISADAGASFHGLAVPTTQTVNLVNADLTAQQIIDGTGRFAFSAWLATCCGDNPKVTATFDTGGVISLNRGIATGLQTTADILVNPGGPNNAESMGVLTDASRRYWALYEIRGNIPTGATSVTIAVDDGRADAGIATGNGNDNYADMIIFDAVNDVTVIPDDFLKIVIDRDTGAINMVNNTVAAVDMNGYSILSSNGTLSESSATFLADSDSDWVQLTAAGSTGDLSEGHLTTETVATGAFHSFGSGSWQQYFDESDVTFEYLDGNNVIQTGLVEFTGTTQATPFQEGDINFDGNIDGLDWLAYVANLGNTFAAQTVSDAYRDGDFDNDGDNDHVDFLTFKGLFEAANGPGSLAAVAGGAVPEPGSLILLACAGAGVFCFHRRKRISS